MEIRRTYNSQNDGLKKNEVGGFTLPDLFRIKSQESRQSRIGINIDRQTKTLIYTVNCFYVKGPR